MMQAGVQHGLRQRVYAGADGLRMPCTRWLPRTAPITFTCQGVMLGCLDSVASSIATLITLCACCQHEAWAVAFWPCTIMLLYLQLHVSLPMCGRSAYPRSSALMLQLVYLTA
jgi:hypothetical protein